MESSKQKPNLTSFIILASTALPLIILGVYGLDRPDAAPWLANPAVAWSMIAVGLMIEGAATLTLLSELKQVRAKN